MITFKLQVFLFVVWLNFFYKLPNDMSIRPSIFTVSECFKPEKIKEQIFFPNNCNPKRFFEMIKSSNYILTQDF